MLRCGVTQVLILVVHFRRVEVARPLHIVRGHMQSVQIENAIVRSLTADLACSSGSCRCTHNYGARDAITPLANKLGVLAACGFYGRNVGCKVLMCA